MKSEAEIIEKIEEYIKKQDPYWDELRTHSPFSDAYERAANRKAQLAATVQALQWVRGMEPL